jgi:hypothetical protein
MIGATSHCTSMTRHWWCDQWWISVLASMHGVEELEQGAGKPPPLYWHPHPPSPAWLATSSAANRLLHPPVTSYTIDHPPTHPPSVMLRAGTTRWHTESWTCHRIGTMTRKNGVVLVLCLRRDMTRHEVPSCQLCSCRVVLDQ